MKEFKEYEEFKEEGLSSKRASISSALPCQMNPSGAFHKIFQPVFLAGCRKGRSQSNPTPK